MKPLCISLQPSARIALFLSLLYMGAVAATVSLPVAMWPKAIFIFAAAVSFKRELDEFALLRAPDAILAIRVTRKGKFYAERQIDGWLQGQLLPTTFVSSRLTILNFRCPGEPRTRTILLCFGNADPHDFRRLRLWLRWGRLDLKDPAHRAIF